MKNDYNLIFEDESSYGFLYDIRRMFVDSMNDENYNDVDKEVFEEVIRDIDQISEEDEDSCFKIYKCEYCAMGGFTLIEMKEVR